MISVLKFYTNTFKALSRGLRTCLKLFSQASTRLTLISFRSSVECDLLKEGGLPCVSSLKCFFFSAH